MNPKKHANKRLMRPASERGTARGDTFSVYYGEFLVSPCPIELSFNYCSHKCYYCFANLNNRGRWADSAASLRLLADLDNRKTLLAHLLRERYPVVVSNRTDPFAASNWRVSLPVLRVMADMGIPVSIQTRGGNGADEAIEMLPPSVWYVSVTTLDDDVRRRVEPGAPTVQSRIDLISRAAAYGHRVVVGFNPAVPEWQPDPAALCETVKAAGAEGVWSQMLHFNRTQVQAMTDREKGAIGGDVIARARKRSGRDDAAYFSSLRDAAASIGLHFFSGGQAQRSGFWDVFREVYPRTFPVMQDFVNACHDLDFGRDDLISHDDFVNFFASDLPDGAHSIGHYLGATSQQALKREPMPNRTTYRQILSRAFRDEGVAFSPQRALAFSRASLPGEGGFSECIDLVDDRGRPYYVFDPAGHEFDRALVEE